MKSCYAIKTYASQGTDGHFRLIEARSARMSNAHSGSFFLSIAVKLLKRGATALTQARIGNRLTNDTSKLSNLDEVRQELQSADYGTTSTSNMYVRSSLALERLLVRN